MVKGFRCTISHLEHNGTSVGTDLVTGGYGSNGSRKMELGFGKIRNDLLDVDAAEEELGKRKKMIGEW